MLGGFKEKLYYLVPFEETLSPSGQSLVSLGNLSLSSEVIYSLNDETLSPSSVALDVFPQIFYL